MSNEEFQKFINSIQLDDKTIANKLRLPVITITRWREGKSFPHTLMIPALVDEMKEEFSPEAFKP